MLPYQKEAVEMMIRHEHAMRDLYLVYASKFTDYAEFWRDLSREETIHAETVAQIGKSLDSGKTNFSRNRFKVEAIALSIRFIEEKIAQAKSEELPLFYALTVTLDIEKALIENEYFIVVEDDPPELKNTLRALQFGAEKHLEKVTLAWEKQKALI